MKARFNYNAALYEAMDALDRYTQECGLERTLIDLVRLRASQLNGCAYCIDMHWKDLRAAGENEQRLYGLDAWRESPYYTDRERAALEWIEAVTNIRDGHASDAIYASVREHLKDKEIADLTFIAAAIGAWNRLSIASRLVPGGYEVTK
jgi:AhpD family alkylhydroperoxidase